MTEAKIVRLYEGMYPRKPYVAGDAKCEKCGYYGEPLSKYKIWESAPTPLLHYVDEYIKRTCARCAHSWSEAPLTYVFGTEKEAEQARLNMEGK